MILNFYKKISTRWSITAVIAALAFSLLFFSEGMREITIKITEHILHRSLYHFVWHRFLTICAFYFTAVFSGILCILLYFFGKPKWAKIGILVLCSFVMIYSSVDNYNSQYFADGQKIFDGKLPFFMHSPFYEGQLDSKFTVRQSPLFTMARHGVLVFYVNKYEEAEKGGADGVTVIVYANDKEIASLYENPYEFAGNKHTVTLSFDIPARTRILSISITANGNPNWDHTYIEKLDVRKLNFFGYLILLSAFAIPVWMFFIRKRRLSFFKAGNIKSMFVIPLIVALAGIFIHTFNSHFTNIISGFLIWSAIVFCFYTTILWALSLCKIELKITSKEIIALCGILFTICAIILSVISRSRTIHFWDNGGYWEESLRQGENIFHNSPIFTLLEIARRIKYDEYNNFIATLVSVPLRVLGKSYIAFAIVIFTMFVFPVTFILSMMVKKINEKFNVSQLPLCYLMAILIMISGILAPIFNGYFDSAVLVPISALLLLTFCLDFRKFETEKYICIAVLCLAVLLIRRYFGFFIVGYVFALFVKVFSDWIIEKQERKTIFKNFLLSMFLIGGICFAILFVFFMPLIKRNLLTNYAEIYSAYRRGSIWDNIRQIGRSFGGIFLFFAFTGLVYLLLKKKTRSFALFLAASIIVTLYLFINTQSMGLHHRYILLAQITVLAGSGITVCCTILKKWCNKKTALTVVYSLCSFAFLMMFFPVNNFLFSSYKIMPIVRNDMPVIGQIIADINEQKKSTYVLASSTMFNSGTLKKYAMPFQYDASPYSLGSHDIDLRDGFPAHLMQAEMVLVGDPIQLHLPSGQEIIEIPAGEILKGIGIGKKYRFIKEYQLDRGVKAKLYERIEPYTSEDGEYLSKIFDELYPNYKHIFRERIMNSF